MAPLLTDERDDLIESMVVQCLEDMQEHVVGVLSKAGLAHVSSRTVWSLLVQGSRPVWHTSASSCITVGTVAAACVKIARSCCSASALGLVAKKRTTASRTQSASEAIVGRETVSDKGERSGARSSAEPNCFGGLKHGPTSHSDKHH